MLYYICDVCGRRPIKSKVNWIEHYNTKKHKENSHKATHKCLNCNSCFIFDNEDSEYKKNFENHMEKCKKNIIDKLIEENTNNDGEDETKNDLLKKISESEKEVKNINKIKEENIKLGEENINLKEENIKLKEEVKTMNKFEKEYLELKEQNKESKYENKLLKEDIKSLHEEIKLLNDKIQKILVDSKTEVKQVLFESTDKFQKVMSDSNSDIIKICDKQLNFAQTVSKDSNKITSSAMTLLGFLQKQCPDAPPLLEFTNDNYEYTFTFDKDFVYDILYSFDNDTVGEFIGKIINEMFLKENKEDQSMFATDCVRLNYSIKEYINENKNRWAKKS